MNLKVGKCLYTGARPIAPSFIDNLPADTRLLKFRRRGMIMRVFARLHNGISIGVLEVLEGGRFKFIAIANGTQRREAVPA